MIVQDGTHYLDVTPHSTEGLSLWANNNFEKLCSPALKVRSGSALCDWWSLILVLCFKSGHISWKISAVNSSRRWVVIRVKDRCLLRLPQTMFDIYLPFYRSHRLEEWFLAVIGVEGRTRRPSQWHIQPQDENRRPPTHTSMCTHSKECVILRTSVNSQTFCTSVLWFVQPITEKPK